MYEINQHITPDREIHVKIRIESLEKISNGKEILKKYKISNFWKGNFFLKRLINKIFKYQLNKPLKWDQKFWDIIYVMGGVSKIEIPDSLESLIKERTLTKRFQDIKKYQNLINNNIDIGPLLYITGGAINYLGGNVKKDELFILDGSRRLIANILNKKNPKILLIDLKNE